MGSKLSIGNHVNTNTVNSFTSSFDGKFDALFDAAAMLFGINRQTVDFIIQPKSEIMANTELAASLEVQLRSTMKTLHAMRTFNYNLHQARAVVLLISRDAADGAQMLENLKDLKNMRFHLEEKFKSAFDQHDQLTVLNGLRHRKDNLEDKLRRIKSWRKTLNITQWIAKLGVTVLSVVIPVARVRPVATAANNGAGGVIALLHPLAESTLDDQQSSCEEEIDLTAKILNEASFIFHRVNGVLVLVEHLVVEMGLLIQSAELPTGEDEDSAVWMLKEKIKGRAWELVDAIKNLEEVVDRGCEDVRRAALTLLQISTDQVENYPHEHEQVETPV